MRTCRARSVHLLGGSRLPSLSSTRRDQYIRPWLFSIRCLGPASSREPVFPSYRGTATDSQGRLAPAITPCGRLLHRHESAIEVGRPLRLPRFGGATYADSCNDWSRHREVGFPGAWS